MTPWYAGHHRNQIGPQSHDFGDLEFRRSQLPQVPGNPVLLFWSHHFPLYFHQRMSQVPHRRIDSSLGQLALWVLKP